MSLTRKSKSLKRRAQRQCRTSSLISTSIKMQASRLIVPTRKLRVGTHSLIAKMTTLNLMNRRRIIFSTSRCLKHHSKLCIQQNSSLKMKFRNRKQANLALRSYHCSKTMSSIYGLKLTSMQRLKTSLSINLNYLRMLYNQRHNSRSIIKKLRKMKMIHLLR